MTDGGIVVLEMHAATTDQSGREVMAPAEINPNLRAWIREAALNRGILTVVPAGTSNPAADLNTLEALCLLGTSPETWGLKAVWNGLPESDPNHSLGVMVGGGDPNSQKAVTNTDYATNYGIRVDCQGWGADVVTTGGPGLQDYVDDFNGTSSATAMIGGVAASLQGAYKSAYGQQLPPNDLRHLLSDSSLGTPQPIPDAVLRHIGPLPDLAAMLRRLRILGDVYIRDSVKDLGVTPHKLPATFLSPDIIVVPAGQWSAEGQDFWDEHLDEDLEGGFTPGIPLDVLVRVHNRSMNPGGVTVNAYWTEPGLFLDSGIWTEIGPAQQTIVPAYDHKVVRIPWAEILRPRSPEICLIATLDSECDPLAIGERYRSFEHYIRFLRTSNNIAHRNLQCVNLALGQKEAQFAFFLGGILRMEDWIQDQGFFRLVIEGRLPRWSVVTLYPGEPQYGTGSEAGGLIPGAPYKVIAPAPLILGGFRLPAGARIPMRLEVTLPDDPPAMDYYLHADQFYGDDLIGRGNFLIRYGQAV
jgi:hypothetical protein